MHLSQVLVLCAVLRGASHRFNSGLVWLLKVRLFNEQIGKTSAFIGPFVSSAIITAADNNNMPFAFLFGLYVSKHAFIPNISCGLSSSVCSTIFLVMVDVDQSRIECDEFIKAEAERNAFKMEIGSLRVTQAEKNN